MNLALSIAVYFIIWWLVLFTVLPIGMRDQREAGDVAAGTPGSAPANPQMWRKAVITTFISAVIFAALYVTLTWNLIDGQWLDRVLGIGRRS